ncbi:BrnA antitoxin family protein [Aquicoccus sp. G2-2]|uniref:BrnA antitoxin family protein n=1 Tax=Aquicoccus sp. G2-2 TaxID=3092120 RepID=UPI002AE03054|nr:BrnA antitoxin family protein [Aquicoccus sp. G2-2]MEA1113275.1 BrnA antitoxin family protein [Aquicoccus sp. G2-2]
MRQTKQAAEVELLGELKRFQAELTEAWVDRSLPEEWGGLESTAPLPKLREKVTLRLDADMVRWFRKLGPGYGRRINAVLRIYWQALIAGRIKAHWDEEEMAPAFLEMVERMAQLRGVREDG